MTARRPCDATPATDERARAGVMNLLRRLVPSHRARLARLARREGLGPEDAFDAVQEAFQSFLVLPEATSLADAPEAAGKLLAALTRNVARNRRRLHAVARPHTSAPEVLEALPTAAASVEELLAAAEDQMRLAGCVHTLADLQRTVVTLRMLEEVPGEDVARTLGIEPGHVAVLLHRAKANLLACMTRDAGR